MERLELYANNVFGEIPSAISALSDLLLFDVEQNLLSGAVLPDSLPDSLIAYRASSNFLEGSIPTSITRFSKLEQIWLGDCPLTGTIPSEIGLLTDLQYIFFYDSTFQGDLMGTLPSELGNLKKLIDFRLYGNQVGERIPSGLFGATSLETLILDNNFFIKSLPTEIGKLSNLGYLRLDGNQITGTLPTEIGRMVHLGKFKRDIFFCFFF
jgi:Leucine-rich repeat (LRR) protein